MPNTPDPYDPHDMAAADREDPYDMAAGDYEDPEVHVFDTMCTGCDMCAPWEGRPYTHIRAERRALVAARRDASA